MSSLKTFALAGAVLAGAAAAASAADLRGPIPIGLPPAPIVGPIVEASGWYLRGDVGVGELNGKTSIEQVGVGSSRGHAENFGSFVSGGVGVGYQFNSWLRADITGEYRTKASTSFADKYCNALDGGGNFLAPTCNGASPFQREGFNRINGNIGSYVFLANGYVDLGTWYGLTPYVGAGVGFASLRASGFNDVGGNYARDNATGAILAGTSFATGGYLANRDKTNFAWALMAGLGYDVSERLKLELGYRYLNLGKAETGNAVCFGDPTCQFTVKAKDLDSHEFRLGMRWMLGGPTYAAAPPPAYSVVKKF